MEFPEVIKKNSWGIWGAIALSHPPAPTRVRVRTTVKLSAAFFHDESSITIGGAGGGGGGGGGGGRKCNSAEFRWVYLVSHFGNSSGRNLDPFWNSPI